MAGSNEDDAAAPPGALRSRSLCGVPSATAIDSVEVSNASSVAACGVRGNMTSV
jgi:hypothetical protein